MSFLVCKEGGYYHDIPTTLHRSKADCPVPEVCDLAEVLMTFVLSAG